MLTLLLECAIEGARPMAIGALVGVALIAMNNVILRARERARDRCSTQK